RRNRRHERDPRAPPGNTRAGRDVQGLTGGRVWIHSIGTMHVREGNRERVGQVEQSYRDHLAAVKRQIREQTPAEAAARRDADPAPVLVDVRERDEYEQGYIPGALHIPRGNLESRVERAIPDRSTPVVIYCASGNRSVYAAKTLAELGYEDVVSMSGGFQA